jgi:hypothetical protein
LANLAIFTLPIVNIAVQFLVNWTPLTKQLGGLCGISYSTLYVQIYNLIIVYIIPVSLNILFLSLCIRFVSSTGNIRNQQILNNRRKLHRILLFQSIAFYSIWIILWSPFVLSFQFVNTNSRPGVITSTINYIQVAIDPAIVSIIDIRFLKAWKKTYTKLFRRQRRQIKPLVIISTVLKRN